MIEFSPSNREVSHTLYIYTDIDCGYCRKMHQEINQLNDAGIAVRYLAYPRSGIGGESYDKAVSVWCAADRQQALTESKAGKLLPSASCTNPVADHYRMGEAMGVRGTPAVYLENGTIDRRLRTGARANKNACSTISYRARGRLE